MRQDDRLDDDSVLHKPRFSSPAEALLLEIQEWLSNDWLVLKDERDAGVIEDWLERLPAAIAQATAPQPTCRDCGTTENLADTAAHHGHESGEYRCENCAERAAERADERRQA